MAPKIEIRNVKNKAFLACCWSMGILAAGILCFLISSIIYRGTGAIDLEFLLSPSRDFGSRGGIFYQIVGSLVLVTAAAVLAFPFGVTAGIWKSEYINNARVQKATHLLLYGLNGVPSILFGVFGLVVFVHWLGMGISWFAGSIVLAIMMIPTVTFCTYQTLRQLPDVYRESARALGLKKRTVIRKVILPEGLRGAVTGLLLGLARAIGETAPIMFIATAYSGAGIPDSLNEPVAALPTHILILAKQAIDTKALENAWGSSLVLVLLVLVFSTGALLARTRLQRRQAE